VTKPGTVRRSAIAGTWYPGDPTRLRGTIRDYLANVPLQTPPGTVLGLVAPHAGYVYSGQVAANAYAQLQGKAFSRAVVVSPVHRVYPGRFAITDKSYYETPLGLVAVDTELVRALGQGIQLTRVSEDQEHSLEIQLPFLQYMLGEFSLTPVMMGDQDWESARALGNALAQAIAGRSVLLVASTDLSHFHSYGEARRLDRIVLDRIAAYDPEGLVRELANHDAEACGGGPVAAVMIAAQKLGANRAVVLQYQNSGDVTGDHSSVVGYGAAVLLRA
jgi:MEMO1 family protein